MYSSLPLYTVKEWSQRVAPGLLVRSLLCFRAYEPPSCVFLSVFQVWLFPFSVLFPRVFCDFGLWGSSKCAVLFQAVFGYLASATSLALYLLRPCTSGVIASVYCEVRSDTCIQFGGVVFSIFFALKSFLSGPRPGCSELSSVGTRRFWSVLPVQIRL